MRRPRSNPANPYGVTEVEWDGPAPPCAVEVTEDDARSILTPNQSPDLPFDWNLNAYRGCSHGCAYCYARTGHEKLGLGAGTDFETKLRVKPRAADLLRETFEKPSWKGELIAVSGMTDAYQAIEAEHRLTRACLEVCGEYRNPVGIITKSALVERDVDLLAALARDAYCTVSVSVTFLDAGRARRIEPYAPAPARRLQALRRLADAGVPVGIHIAPIIPGLNDDEIPGILEAARDAGATFAVPILIRLSGSVRDVFEERLREVFPDRAEKVLGQLRACRGGRLNDTRFGHRMRGEGPRWEAIDSLFRLTARRLGFRRRPSLPDPSPFRRPGRAVQRGLFDQAGRDTRGRR